MKLISVATILLSTTACTWVSLSEKGAQVTISNSNNVVLCQRLGSVNAKTRATLLFSAKRNEEKIATELSVLARNEATKMNADTLVAESPPNEKGEQRFIAYRCQ